MKSTPLSSCVCVFMTPPFQISRWLRPPGVRRRRVDSEYLAGARTLADALGPVPLLGHQKQGSPVMAPEHAGEAAAVVLDHLQDFAAFGHANTSSILNRRVPDRPPGNETDPVWDSVAQ